MLDIQVGDRVRIKHLSDDPNDKEGSIFAYDVEVGMECEIVEINDYVDRYGYVGIEIYFPDKGFWQSCYLHQVEPIRPIIKLDDSLFEVE